MEKYIHVKSDGTAEMRSARWIKDNGKDFRVFSGIYGDFCDWHTKFSRLQRQELRDA